DTSMDDAAIVSRLVAREIAFLLQQNDPCTRLCLLHGFRGSKPDNAAAYDAIIIICHEVPSSCLFPAQAPCLATARQDHYLLLIRMRPWLQHRKMAFFVKPVPPCGEVPCAISSTFLLL